MINATVRDARLNLSKLLVCVERGEEVLIRRRSRPVARIVPACAADESALPDLRSFRKKLASRYRAGALARMIRDERDAR